MFPFLAITQAGCRLSSLHRLQRGSTTLAALATIAVIPQFMCAQHLQADQPRRPNIILVMADDISEDLALQNKKHGDLACNSLDHECIDDHWIL